mgnify:CR=1 FL=1
MLIYDSKNKKTPIVDVPVVCDAPRCKIDEWEKVLRNTPYFKKHAKTIYKVSYDNNFADGTLYVFHCDKNRKIVVKGDVDGKFIDITQHDVDVYTLGQYIMQKSRELEYDLLRKIGYILYEE